MRCSMGIDKVHAGKLQIAYFNLYLFIFIYKPLKSQIMKKLLLLVTALIGSASIYAQTISYGIKAGVNFSTFSASIDNISATSKSLTGFHVGGVIDFGFTKSFSIQPGILYSTKGGSSNAVDDGSQAVGASASKVTFNYLEIPVNFLYRASVRKGSVFIGGGPYVAFGLSGSAPFTDNNGPTTNQTQAIHFGSGLDEIHNPDFGINFIGGYQFTSNVTLSVQYGLGLQNLSNDSAVRIHNQALGFSLGYFFK